MILLSLWVGKNKSLWLESENSVEQNAVRLPWKDDSIHRPISYMAAEKPNPTTSEPYFTQYFLSIMDFGCCHFASSQALQMLASPPLSFHLFALMSGPSPPHLLKALNTPPRPQFWLKSVLLHSALCCTMHDHCSCHGWHDPGLDEY